MSNVDLMSKEIQLLFTRTPLPLLNFYFNFKHNLIKNITRILDYICGFFLFPTSGSVI